MPVIVGLGIGVVLPLIALIVGTGVLGSEIDDGTVAHILAKPIPRSEIILSKLVVAVVVTAVTVAVPMFVVGLIAGSSQLGARPGRRRAARRARVQRAVPRAEPGDPAAGAGRPALRADLGGPAQQPAVRHPVLSIQQYVMAVADRIAAPTCSRAMSR